MSAKVRVALSLALLFSLVLSVGAQARELSPGRTAVAGAANDTQSQASNGSIRGTVYRDANNDGLCAGEGEGPLAGIPIRFTSGDETLFLQSGEDGSFGLVAAGLGFWEVAPEPSAEQGVVTSTSPRGVTLTAEDPLVTGVDFCIGTEAAAAAAGLPVSGAPAMPALWLVALLGLVLLGLGVLLYVRSALLERR